jgi:hypothetical protein
MATALPSLPDHGVDVTAIAVPRRWCREAGDEVVFATEAGATPVCDPLRLTGVVFGARAADLTSPAMSESH